MLDITLRPPNTWRSAAIPKKDGSLRYLLIPNDALKQVQHDILEFLYNQKFVIYKNACGFIPGKCTLDGVLVHDKASPCIVTMDVHDFFPSFPVSTVEQQLARKLRTPFVDYIIDTCSFHGRDRHMLPQGAPTSPYLTNIGMRNVDMKISGLANRLGFTYSRYADDLTFAYARQDSDYDRKVCALIKITENILSEISLKVAREKTHVIRLNSNKARRITGVTVRKDGLGYNAPVHYRRKARAALHNLYKALQAGEDPGACKADYKRIVGMIQYCDLLRSASDESCNFADPKINKFEFEYVRRCLDA